MTCEHVKEHLSAYLDNALSFEERLSIAAHIENCQSCQCVLADFARIDALLAHLPRISPKPTLRERIFSSQEYLELIGPDTYSGAGPGPAFKGKSSSLQSSRPRLTSLPGGRQAPKTPSSSSKTTQDTVPIPKQKAALPRKQQIFYSIVAASILLTIGIGGLMSRGLWQQQEKTTQSVDAITPPAALSQQGPLSAGTRFLFLQDGSLWSCASDGSSSSRLTAKTVTVTNGWTIRPGINGHSAGNLIAYIDTRQGFVHVIRSDGQTDTLIPQVLVPAKEQRATTWQTTEGQNILNSLSWSPDGSTLAFVGRDGMQKQDSLYLYQPGSNSVHQIPFSLQESASTPVWSSDSKHIAFQFTQNGAVSIAEYHLQNHEVVKIVQRINTEPYLQDRVLSLDWTADNTALTWSVGSSEHIHTIWLKQVSLTTNNAPILLRAGDFVQASYNPALAGRWLFVTASGDIYLISLNALLERLTRGRVVSNAQWSPDGHFITYLDASNISILHQINISTLMDIQVGIGVDSTPAPLWSMNQQQLAYSTNTALYVADEQAPEHPHALGLQGHISAISWSSNNPNQVIVALSDQNKGIYILDSHKNSVQQVDSGSTQGGIQWSEIP